MTDINQQYAEALAALVADCLTSMHKQDGAATQQLIENCEAGKAQLIIQSELIPQFSVRALYVTNAGSSELFTISDANKH